MVEKKVLDKVVWDKWSKSKRAELKPTVNGWSQAVMPWKGEFKQDTSSDQPFVYRAEGKFISFKPAGLWWATPQGPSTIKQGVNSSMGNVVEGKARYANALGTGISIEASVSRDRWRKEVVIDSLVALGTIPVGAEFLEIGFEIETDFDIPEWDGKSEYQFNTAIELTELTRIESIRTWDSHVIPEPKEGEEREEHFLRCAGFIRVVDGKTYLVKRIPVDYLQNAVYPVITDTVISYGAEYEFNAVTTDYISCAALDSTHFVVGYRDAGGGNFGHAKIGVVTGNAIAYGAEYEFNAATTNYISCAALDATHFVVGYRDDGGDTFGHAKIGVVSSGDEIAYGAEYEFNAAATTNISCAALDSTNFVVGYQDAGGDTFGHAKIGVVTGNAIAYGAEYEFNAAATSYISCAALDATHFVVGYRDAGGDTFGHAKIGVVTGNAIAYGAEYEFNAAATFYISCAALDATHFVVGYRDAGGGGRGHSKIGVVSSGDEIAYGAGYEFNAVLPNYVSCAALDATHFVVGYQDAGGDGYGIAMIGVVTGNAIAYGAEYEFNATFTFYVSCAALDSTNFVVGYQDTGGAGYGIAMIGTLSEPAGLENKSANMGSKMVAAGLI